MKIYLPIVWMFFLYTAKAQPFLDYSFDSSLPSLSSDAPLESFLFENPSSSKLNEDNLVAQYIDYWNSADMAWSISDSLTFEYNADDQLLNVKSRRLIDGEWELQQRADYSYNEDGLLSSLVTSSWLGTNWGYTDLNTRANYTYDDNMQMISRIQEDWEEGAWQMSFRNTWDYDPVNQLLTTEANAYWVDAEWQNSSRTRYLEYDELENAILEERDYWSSDNEWTPQTRFNRVYSLSNLIQLINIESYSVEDEEWRASVRRTYTYDDNDFLESWLQEFWSLESTIPGWEKYIRNIYTNTVDGLVLNLQNQNWNNDLEEWINSYQESFEYNENNQEYYHLYERWNSVAEIWENNQQVFSYYGEGLTNIEEISNTSDLSVRVFPNPSTGQININFLEEDFNDDQVMINVYTIDGRIAKETGIQPTNDHTISLDLSNLLPGSYVIHVMVGLYNWAHFIELKK